MPIPDFQEITLPLLKLSGDQNDHTLPETEEALANFFQLTQEERVEMLPSGTQRRFANRVAWAKVYLTKAGLLLSPRRSVYRISQSGLDLLKNPPPHISVSFLKEHYKEIREFLKPSKDNGQTEVTSAGESSTTPRETLEAAYEVLRKQLVQEVLDRVKQTTPRYFEELVVDLLVGMGYGGTLSDAGRATQFTNDEGIDGVIKQDKLGLDVIYVQAKKYTDKVVGRPDVQAFVGALDGKHANKGVFITTSRFADSAITYARDISKKVVLIDGEQLANYMIDYNLGVSTSATFTLKRI